MDKFCEQILKFFWKSIQFAYTIIELKQSK